MIKQILDDKPTKLFLFFTAFFVANALIAECIGSKLFSRSYALIYLVERRMEKYFGHEVTHRMKQAAMGKTVDG
jgi:hypothetical protein